ncbi:MAG TPA: PP2C family protein-serine/threonine phosphatase [Vicinamibacterales bacterium]|nr:PP2C family protein-serine/threonine phosphatase [Vicinamibacterales bacterium]HOG29804.1 PP2C family protein-serine/threonine phosphatase [Vicinamibacterales bacterium]HOQ60046.1 PP2C family protein-serine/threonine phosphatase [Vicinamibacterales bacterium]HPW20572.1 PP2C family protein-serine/threonine phosphatase [Vicinamibacterales bacterium]
MTNGTRPAPVSDKPIWETLKQDWRYVRDDFGPAWRATLRMTVAELEEFYLTPEHRSRLRGMGAVKRWFSLAWWLLKGLFLKLAPLRRVILLVALLLLLNSAQIDSVRGARVSVDGSLFAAVLLLGLLLLELKDKLLARHELEAGRAVQRALMPERCPGLGGWDVWSYTRPANDVGGDLVDCLELGPGRVGFALADVAGKALPAALLMAKVQSTLRALATDVQSLSQLASKTNAILCRDGLSNRFATLVYLELRDRDGVVRLVNAGHMPPVRISGGTFHELPRGDMALGMMPASTYQERQLELRPGEMLVVYSDGLTEALNEAGEFYGDERLRSVFAGLGGLSAAEAGARLLASVDAFIGRTRPYDDLSLVILRREGVGTNFGSALPIATRP